ncbi:MAG: heavy metal translocating P-type ATPase [Anaerovoracaceae bacterium]
MNKKQKIQLTRIILSGALLLIGSLIPMIEWISIGILLTSYLIAGYDTLFTAMRNILHGQVFDENFLMTIATIGALALTDYSEAVFVMLFYLVGTMFEEFAVNKSRASIAELMNIRPDFANLIRDGKEEKVDPYEVNIGDIIIVKPGERVPLDGEIIEGNSALDASALTGESLPKDASKGQPITSGCINITGMLKIKVSSVFEDCTVAKILDMVENAGNKKAKVEKFITKFAQYYTPIVVFAALALAVIPPLILPGQTFSEWVGRALIFLVISCPCALVISVPLAFFGGVGGASKCGILVKGSNYLEALAHVETVIFDKTGTLTTGTFAVTQINSKEIPPDKLLELAAYGESYSNHPISLSIRQAFKRPIDKNKISSVKEIAGKGIKSVISGETVYVGNEKLMAQIGIKNLEVTHSETLVHLAVEEKYMGYICISDTIKPDAKNVIRELKSKGVKSTIMLTGDRKEVAKKVAATIGIDEFHSQLLPGDKVELAEKIIDEKSLKGNVVFLGDGINDAPVLARADIGVAMGGLGSQAAIEAADVVIMDDKPSKLSTVITIARKTLSIAKQNVIFALTIKAIVLILGTLGMASMWEAVFADVGVCVIAILNSMRSLQTKKLR